MLLIVSCLALVASALGECCHAHIVAQSVAEHLVLVPSGEPGYDGHKHTWTCTNVVWCDDGGVDKMPWASLTFMTLVKALVNCLLMVSVLGPRVRSAFNQAPGERLQQDCEWRECRVRVLAVAGVPSGNLHSSFKETHTLFRNSSRVTCSATGIPNPSSSRKTMASTSVEDLCSAHTGWSQLLIAVSGKWFCPQVLHLCPPPALLADTVSGSIVSDFKRFPLEI